MVKLLTVLVLSLMLLSTFILPTTVHAADPSCIFSDILSTLPPTNVTGTTATFNGRETQSLSISFGAFGAQLKYPWLFKYGTQSGIYTKQARAHLASTHTERDNSRNIISMIWDDTATVTDLTPCTTYYVLYAPDPSGGVQSASAGTIIYCNMIYRNATEITFKTTGCMAGPLGQGGSAPGTGGTTSSLSSLPSSAPVQMASVLVQSAAIATTKVSPGQDVDIAATVTNKGTANGDAKLTLYVNGEAVESKGVTVAAGQTAPVHFNVNRNDPGTYEVYVNGTPAGSFTVDVFTNNDNLIYTIMALFVMGIASTLFFLFRKRTA